MLVHKCDRCRKIFPIPEDKPIKNMVRLVSTDKNGNIYNEEIFKSEFRPEIYDICSDCMNKIRDFLIGNEFEEEKKENEDNEC